jgi:hypothetical protein
MNKTKAKNPKHTATTAGAVRRYYFDVIVVEPKPNKMFNEWQHAITKYLTYQRPVKCAYCSKMSKHHWTQLKFFRIAEGFERKLPNGKVVPSNEFQLENGKELFPPLTPVCTKHILAPDHELRQLKNSNPRQRRSDAERN